MMPLTDQEERDGELFRRGGHPEFSISLESTFVTKLRQHFAVDCGEHTAYTVRYFELAESRSPLYLERSQKRNERKKESAEKKSQFEIGSDFQSSRM
jgi:hypothetical protein